MKQTQQPKQQPTVHAFTGTAAGAGIPARANAPTVRENISRLWCGDAGIKPEAVDDAGTVTLANGATVCAGEIVAAAPFGHGHAAFIAAIRAASREGVTQ